MAPSFNLKSELFVNRGPILTEQTIDQGKRVDFLVTSITANGNVVWEGWPTLMDFMIILLLPMVSKPYQMFDITFLSWTASHE